MTNLVRPAARPLHTKPMPIKAIRAKPESPVVLIRGLRMTAIGRGRLFMMKVLAKVTDDGGDGVL